MKRIDKNRYPNVGICEVIFVVLASLSCNLLIGVHVLGAEASKIAEPVCIKNVQIKDNFWAPKQKIIRENTIPHSWPYVSSSIEELKNAATPEKKPVQKNGKWMEANLHKVLETAAYALAQESNPSLEQKVDEIIAIIAAAQQPDGFVHAWVINRRLSPWGDLYHQHDGYVSGHLYEAAVNHFRATGKKNFLEVACKSADQAYDHFIVQGNPGFPGHAEIELALVELYRVVGEQRYLELARTFIERRGRHPERATKFPPAYFQDDFPVRQQQELKGHAVRAIFFATGVADLALETGDQDMREAANRLWQSVSKYKMYITGSIGSSAKHEAFAANYELPNDGYCESCAACGMADFAHRMFMLKGDADAADELERVLYNAIPHGIGLDGKTFYYRNPLSDHNHPRANNWCCCPPTLSRTLLQVGRYAYAHTGEDIYVNLFVGGSCGIPLKEGLVNLEVKTEYPWDGAVEITVLPEQRSTFGIRVRIPGWCKGAKGKLNGQKIGKMKMCKGYAVIRREWKKGDVIALNLLMPVMRIEAHPQVKADTGKVAIQRGPLIYGLEGLDNGGNLEIALPADPEFETEHRADLLGGVTVIKGITAEDKPFMAIPFYALANREKSTQVVWLNQIDKKENPTGWEGKLYRGIWIKGG